MGESGTCVFPMEDALEMILMFDRTGRIYASLEKAANLLAYLLPASIMKNRIPQSPY